MKILVGLGAPGKEQHRSPRNDAQFRERRRRIASRIEHIAIDAEWFCNRCVDAELR